MLYAAKIDVEDGSSSFKLIIDGLEIAESAVPPWLAVEANPAEITVDPPLGYQWVNSGSIWINTDSQNHRIEIKAEHDDYLMFGFDNPSVMQFNNQHIGVCLASVEAENPWDIQYVLNGQVIKEVSGNPIPYQFRWTDPERQSNSLIINDTITTVGQQAFRGWENATSLTIANSVKIIHPQAFQYWYKLPNLILPSSVEEIWEEAFQDARLLTSITIFAVNPPILKNVNVFWVGNQKTTAKFYVPAESLSAYKSAEVWSEYADQIFAIS